MKFLKFSSIYSLLAALCGFSLPVNATTVNPHVNIAVLGAQSDGPRDLGLALIAAAKGSMPSAADFVGAGDVTYIEYEINQTHFAHALFQNISPENYGQFYQALQSLDGAVFSIEQGKNISTHVLDQCLAAKAAGVPKLFVYAWNESGVQLKSESEIYSLFSSCGYQPNNIVVIQGKAQRHRNGEVSYHDVSVLLNILSKNLKPRTQDSDAAFALPIDDIFNILGRGTIVTGRVASGETLIGNELVVVGFGKELRTKVVDIDMFRRKLTVARAGDHVGITLQDIKRSDVARGMFLTTTANVRQASTISATLTFTNDFYIRDAKPSPSSNEYMFLAGTISVPVKVKQLAGKSVVIDASQPIPIIKGWSFILRREGKTLAVGRFD